MPTKAKAKAAAARRRPIESPIVEPSYAVASQWWPDLENVWTPVGWKDHLFRFNVLWNGTVLAEPHLNNRTTRWKGEGMQCAFSPHPKTSPAVQKKFGYEHQDDNLVRQGWREGSSAPVLWTEWTHEGIVYRKEMFAHVPGGQPVQSGVEPLFAWVRLSVHDVCPVIPINPVAGFTLYIHAPHLVATMSKRANLVFHEERSAYPRELRPEPAEYSDGRGLRLVEPDGRVRLGILPGQPCRTEWQTSPNRLYIEMSSKPGTRVDLLMPLLPADPSTFDEELSAGFNRALREAEKYWSAKPSTAATVRVPERKIEEAIERSIQFNQINVEKHPDTGQYCKLSGSFQYASLWSTPMAMDLVMMLDCLGYHAEVERYLEIFRHEQGTVKPPGQAYEMHRGYLSSPAAYKSIDWLSDHGAILYSIANHALLSHDEAFAERFTDTIVKACEWIRDARALSAPGSVPGVIPAAVATDRKTEIQALWNIGWIYKALVLAVRVLKRVNHPRTAEFEKEQRQYRDTFLRAFRAACKRAPTWVDPDGKRRRFVPTMLDEGIPAEHRHAFYLDTGPLFLVFAGLVPADDPLMEDVRAWFERGPQWAMYRHDSNCWQVAVLDHGISSCEPCYSWNAFHSWQLGDRNAFLETMYSVFAGALSRKTYIGCETRGGISAMACTASLAIYLARLSVIDDQIAEGELHLLRLVPQAWLQAGQPMRWENVPTEYGPVSLTAQLSRDGRKLDVSYALKFRTGTEPKVVLHAPPLPGLQAVRFNGKPVSASRGRAWTAPSTARARSRRAMARSR